MRENVLYGAAATLPNIRDHFHRPRIDALLDGLMDRHLLVVTAGPGSGKTHAVSAFLQNARARVFWFQLSELNNNPARFWDEFIYIISSQNKETARQLRQLGFPETLPKIDRFLHILALEIYAHEQAVFVFEDFHLIKDESVLRFVHSLISAKLESCCIIINTRAALPFNLAGMFANGLAGLLTVEDLLFTPDETEEYLSRQGVSLPERELKKIHEVTGGWPMALYLVSLSVKKGGLLSRDPVAGAMPSVFEMLERELFSDFSPPVQNFLIRASLLDSFPEGLVRALAGEHEETVIDFIRHNMFVYDNPYTGHYDFHRLFLDFLCGKQKSLSQREIDETYLCAARWCAENGLKIEALGYYAKCERYDEVLSIMLNFGVATFSKSVADFYINLIDRFPADMLKSNPLLRVHRAGLLVNNAEVDAALDELTRARAELEREPQTAENRAVLGEICCMLGLINLGIANYDFIGQFKQAGLYLPGGSKMIDSSGMALNTRYAIMLPDPAPGGLERMEQAMFAAMPYASKTMHGYGQGLEYLASAEAAYFTGDMKKAAKNAFEAVYRAREKRVADVAASGHFLLMRIEAANGNYEGVTANLEKIKAYAEEPDGGRSFNGMPDVADGWFNLLVGKAGNLAGWLVDDAANGGVLAPYSIGMERAIKARYLLKSGRYFELLAWLAQSEKPLRQYKIWLVLLELLINRAVASHCVQDEKTSHSALCEAYEIARGNGLVTQFVEHGNDIRAVIYSIRQSKAEAIPAVWLDEIYAKAATYEKHLRNIKAQHERTSGRTAGPVNITRREREMLGYLCQGLTNAEIASTCFITVSAVKKTLNNLYIKLGATNRADAVRTAMQLGLTR